MWHDVGKVVIENPSVAYSCHVTLSAHKHMVNSDPKILFTQAESQEEKWDRRKREIALETSEREERCREEA